MQSVAAYSTASKTLTMTEFALNIIPNTVIDAFARGEVVIARWEGALDVAGPQRVEGARHRARTVRRPTNRAGTCAHGTSIARRTH
jgi:hypothetical protein